MLRSAASKVMWLGRATSALVGLVVLFALAIGAANSALAHAGVDAKLFHLGHNNPVTAVSTLAGNLAGAVLKVDNNGTGPALSLEVGSGKAPLAVNAAAGTATGLSADELGGRDSVTYQRRVDGSCAEGSAIRAIDASGRATCETDADGTAQADALRRELGTADARTNEASDPVSFSKVKDVPGGVLSRDAATLDGKDSADFAAAGHRHSTVVRTNSVPAGGSMNTSKTLSVKCLPGEIATGGGGGFTQAAGQDFLHVDTVTVQGTDSRGGPVVASGTVEDNSWANGGLLGSYPMKVVNGNAVIAGEGEPAEAWGVSYIHESKIAVRDVKVWVVCQS